MAAKIKKGDKVIVIAGKDKGKTGEARKMLDDGKRLVVAGVNMARRHTKPSRVSEGGIVSKEAPLDLSNVALVDPKDGKPTRVGFRVEDGKKTRFSKRSGARID